MVNTLSLRMAEDFYLTNAQFSVAVDGVTLGGINTVTAQRGSEQLFNFTGDFGSGPHVVTVNFLNDAFEPGVGDRNLIVEGITLDGVAATGAPTILFGTEARTFSVSAPPAPVSPTDGPDVLRGSGNDDIIYGGGGNDLIYGLASNDTLYGEGGNDTLYGGDGNDTLIGGEGNDVLEGGLGTDITGGGLGNDIHAVEGEFGARTVLEQTGEGYDTVIVIDTFYDGGAAGEIEVFLGTDADQSLLGNQYNQTLIGGGGRDVLQGGIGNDVLIGGDGPDVFFFQGSSRGAALIDLNGFDVIADFTHGEDTIRLTDYVQGRNFDAILGVATEVGGSVLLALTSQIAGTQQLPGGPFFGSETVMITNYTIAQLTASDFGLS